MSFVESVDLLNGLKPVLLARGPVGCGGSVPCDGPEVNVELARVAAPICVIQLRVSPADHPTVFSEPVARVKAGATPPKDRSERFSRRRGTTTNTPIIYSPCTQSVASPPFLERLGGRHHVLRQLLLVPLVSRLFCPGDRLCRGSTV